MLANYSTEIPRKIFRIVTPKRKTSWATKEFTVIWINEWSEEFSLHDNTELFEFKPLEELEKSFNEAGVYEPREIAELIQGLSRLPRYATKTTNHGRDTSRSRK